MVFVLGQQVHDTIGLANLLIICNLLLYLFDLVLVLVTSVFYFNESQTTPKLLPDNNSNPNIAPYVLFCFPTSETMRLSMITLEIEKNYKTLL